MNGRTWRTSHRTHLSVRSYRYVLHTSSESRFQHTPGTPTKVCPSTSRCFR